VFEEVVSGLLYDAYLKYLVTSALKPDSLDVINYYNENKASDYLDPEQIIVREIRVSNRGLADSLLLLLGAGADFSLLAEENGSINPGDGGLYGPFSKKQNRPFFAAASLLNEGEISPVIPSSGGGFSIIKLVERVSSSPRALSLVYVQIEAMLKEFLDFF
jgi:parvulin-like peptidyl-prolyl isomerase